MLERQTVAIERGAVWYSLNNRGLIGAMEVCSLLSTLISLLVWAGIADVNAWWGTNSSQCASDSRSSDLILNLES